MKTTQHTLSTRGAAVLAGIILAAATMVAGVIISAVSGISGQNGVDSVAGVERKAILATAGAAGASIPRPAPDTTSFDKRCKPNSYTVTNNTGGGAQAGPCCDWNESSKKWEIGRNIQIEGSDAEKAAAKNGCSKVDCNSSTSKDKEPTGKVCVPSTDSNGATMAAAALAGAASCKEQDCPATDSRIKTSSDAKAASAEIQQQQKSLKDSAQNIADNCSDPSSSECKGAMSTANTALKTSTDGAVSLEANATPESALKAINSEYNDNEKALGSIAAGNTPDAGFAPDGSATTCGVAVCDPTDPTKPAAAGGADLNKNTQNDKTNGVNNGANNGQNDGQQQNNQKQSGQSGGGSPSFPQTSGQSSSGSTNTCATQSIFSSVASIITSTSQTTMSCATDVNTYNSQLQQYSSAMQQYNYNYQNWRNSYNSQCGTYSQQQPTQPTPVPSPCYTTNTCSSSPSMPDSSTCSNGQYKPTYTNNGGTSCITGWQCVPSTCGYTPAQPTTACSGTWTPSYTGACITSWQCSSNTSVTPTAAMTCNPTTADAGAALTVTYSCGNATVSSGSGFETYGQLSGVATTTIATPSQGTNTATYTLNCLNGGQTASAQCTVQVGTPGIVLTAIPSVFTSAQVSAGTSTTTVGWITTGMSACTISSPTSASFTAANANNTSINGGVPFLATTTTQFVLNCTTLGGATRIATTTVTVQ